MEVKMFVCSRPEEAEIQINDWLRSRSVQLHHITQSQSEKGGKLLFVVSVYFTDNTYSSCLQKAEREHVFG